MKSKRSALLLLTAVLAVACKNEPPTPTVNSNSVQESPAELASSIPVKEDFEDQAHAAITSANLDDQLDALEKQIGN